MSNPDDRLLTARIAALEAACREVDVLERLQRGYPARDGLTDQEVHTIRERMMIRAEALEAWLLAPEDDHG